MLLWIRSVKFLVGCTVYIVGSLWNDYSACGSTLLCAYCQYRWLFTKRFLPFIGHCAWTHAHIDYIAASKKLVKQSKRNRSHLEGFIWSRLAVFLKRVFAVNRELPDLRKVAANLLVVYVLSMRLFQECGVLLHVVSCFLPQRCIAAKFLVRISCDRVSYLSCWKHGMCTCQGCGWCGV